MRLFSPFIRLNTSWKTTGALRIARRYDMRMEQQPHMARANVYAALSTLGVGTQMSFAARERFEEAWKAAKA